MRRIIPEYDDNHIANGDSRPLESRKGTVVFDADEHVRAGTTLEQLAKMKPAFKENGTVTAGNASGLNDRYNFCIVLD